MPMNLVIQEKRKELGLTQEQVAEYLNVSIPAVSRWEKGSTTPDISLLAPLARLLKTDLNTLFCFREELSLEEIGAFCRENGERVRTGGIASGFRAAEEKIHEYPHNETLLHCLTLQLDGLLAMSGLSREEARPYDALLIKWYRQLAESTDSKISGSANYMIVSRLIRDGDYGKAQEILEDMPEKEAVLSSMADKQMLQIRLWLCQGETAKAIESLQRALFATLQKVQLLLCKMVDAELAEGQLQTARRIGDKAAQMVSLFDLWEYHSLLAPLQTASWEQDAQECIRLLRKMLAAMDTPWDMSSSPLFYRLAGTFDPKAMLPAIVSGLEQNTPETAFLHNHREFGALLSEYKAAQAPAAGNINHASDTGNAFFA